ncbi:MAG: hypothetical protein Q8K78_17780 [Planctomycetaceae bacterium]|nr:hypothetical protein [Planctomycetaceae bacterium]
MHPQHAYRPTPADTAPPLLGMWGRLLNTASLYGEVLLRSRFGERHLTLLGVLLGIAGLLFLPMVMVAVFTFFLSSFLLGSLGGLVAAALTTQLPWAKGTIYFHLFTIGFLARACWHFCEMEYRRRSGEQVLSTYSGMPNILWRMVPGLSQNESLIKRFGEPAVLLLFALWVRNTDFLLTLYLATSGIAMFVKGHFEEFLVHQRLYDLHDQMLESQALGGHVRGHAHQPGDVHGVALPAALAGYQPHQARALTSTLQHQFPLAPLPHGLPIGMDARAMAASLPAEFAGLLTPAVALEEPVEDWFVDDDEEPIPDDWYVVPTPEGSPAKLADKASTESRALVRCPGCDRLLWLKPGCEGRRLRCGNRDCRHLILISDALERLPVPRKLGVSHVG